MSASATTFIYDLGRQAELLGQRLLQNPQHNARLALAVSILLIIFIAWSAARLSWQFVHTPSNMTNSAKPNSPQQQRAANTTSTTLANVGKLHMFGEADVKQAASTVKAPVNAPDTRLRLILRGVFASNDPSISMAIIAEKSGKDKSYYIGETLPGNAKLHEVYTDRVILSRAGKFETLRLIKKEAKIGSVDTSSNMTLPTSQKTTRRAATPRIRNLRNTFKSDPQKIWKQIRITPVMKDGRVSGYTFYHNDRNVMKELGLKPKDVITTINGTEVTDMNTMMKMMNELGKMNEINLSILRNGNPESISIQLN